MMRRLRRIVKREVLDRLRQHGWTFARDASLVALAYVIAEFIRFDGAIPFPDAASLLIVLPAIVFTYGLFSYQFGVHRRLWQYAGARDVRAITDACIWSVLVVGVVDLAVPGERPVPFSVVPAGGAFAMLALIGIRMWSRLVRTPPQADDSWTRVLIVGAGHGGQLVAADLLGNERWRAQPIGFIDDDPRKRKMRIHDLPVLGTIDDLPNVVAAHAVDIVGVAIPSASSHQIDRILALALKTEARIQIVPTRAEILAGKGPLRLRDINLNDLIDRDPLSGRLDSILDPEAVRDRVILVTGGAGSIGSELCRQLLRLEPARVLALDNNESGLFYLQSEVRDSPDRALLHLVLADITDSGKLARVFRTYRPDVVFHAAAYKHVPMLEAHPDEAVYVNVQGTLNVCRAAKDAGVQRLVFISTDKAVQPVNVLGYSKRVGEHIVRSFADEDFVSCCVRFGNVVGSRGSALPEFVRQIDGGGPVTVTHPDVERYFMTIPEAVSLVIQAGAQARGGELFMLDMGAPIKIGDLVDRIIRLRGLRAGKDIEIVYTGLRPGEKLTEDLVFDVEQVEPTDCSAIYRVVDAWRPSLPQLEDAVDVLLQVATQGDHGAIRSELAAAADGQSLESAHARRLDSVG